MNNNDDRKTKFFIQTGFFEIATIYVIICGETDTQKNGVLCLTEKGKNQIRNSVKHNLRKILGKFRPQIFARAPKFYAEETVMEFARLLSGELNRKSIFSLSGLDLPNAPEEVTITKVLWRGARRIAGLKHVMFWRNKIRHYHWLKAGGKTAWILKTSTEKTLFDLARRIALRPDKDTQPIGVVAGTAPFFNLVAFDRDVEPPYQLINSIRVEIPPLKPGDIIKYEFFVEGRYADKIEFVGYQYLPA
jgi:hypothetical protein